MSSVSSMPSPSKPLAPMWVGAAILIFFPIGLYLLWRHPTLRHNKVWWGVGIAWGLLYSIANLTRPAENTHADAGSDTAAMTASEPVVEKGPVKRSMWGPNQLAYKKRVDLCDNPDKYKDTEMKMEVHYEGGGERVGGKLVSLPCRVFYGDGSFNMQFEIPGDVAQPSIKPGQYLMVTFVFSGSIDTPSTVTKLARK